MKDLFNSSQEKEYIQLFNDIKSHVQRAHVKAVKAVSSEMVALYWQIGGLVLERQELYGWGKSVVDKLSSDLQREYHDKTGFSPSNIWRMRQMHQEYSDTSILAQVVRELKCADNNAQEMLLQLVCSVPWGQNILILEKIKEPSARLYYLRCTAGYGWSRNILLNQIKAKSYQRSIDEKKQHNFHLTLSEHFAEQAEESIRSSYSLAFLNLENPVSERELENRLVGQIRDFLMELGYGFAYLGNQYKIKLGDNEYFIDLLFYHRKLQCLVAIELKIGKFEPSHAAQLNYYLEVLDDTVKMPHEKPSIGILLCAEKDSIEVEYALRVINKPVGVAQYQLTNDLPFELKSEFPDLLELKNRLLNQARKE